MQIQKFQKNPLAVILGVSFGFFLVFLLVAGYFLNSVNSGKQNKKLFSKSKNVGVIEVTGAIMDSKKTLEQIEEFYEDELVRGVVIRINSPGGAVAPSQEIYDAVKRLSQKKPTYASFGSIAASGGFYIGMGAKKIYSSPGTITASIGVIMQFADMSKLFQWAKVTPYNIKTGKFKDIGSPNREMTAEERDLLNKMVQNVLEQFRKAVAESRNLSMEKVIEISDGRIMSGEQAKEANLVDELGGLKETVDAVAKEVGISGKPNVVYPSKKQKFLEKLLSSEDDAESSSQITGKWKVISQIAKLLLDVDSASNNGGTPFSEASAGPMFIAPFAVQK